MDRYGHIFTCWFMQTKKQSKSPPLKKLKKQFLGCWVEKTIWRINVTIGTQTLDPEHVLEKNVHCAIKKFAQISLKKANFVAFALRE
jgi:hypothetical protein